MTAVRNLDQDVMHNVSSDIRQPEIATAVEICQAGVIQTHQVEHGGVKIVNMRLLLHGLIPKIISGAGRYASLDSSTGEQDRKSLVVMVTAILGHCFNRPLLSTAGVQIRRR